MAFSISSFATRTVIRISEVEIIWMLTLQYVCGVQLAEPVVTHMGFPGPSASVRVFAVQDPQRHAHARQLAMNPGPVGLLVHAFALTPTGNNRAYTSPSVLPATSSQPTPDGPRRIEHIGNAPARHALRPRDRTPRQTLGMQTQHQFRLYFSYHCW